VVLNPPKLAGVGKEPREFFEQERGFLVGAWRGPRREPLPRERFERSSPRARTVLFIGIMLFAHLTAWQRPWRDPLADQTTWTLSETTKRVERVSGWRIQPSDWLPSRQELRVERPDPPGPFELGLQFVFVRTFPTCGGESLSQKPASTTWSANQRRLPRAGPSGASLQAKAVIWARGSPSLSIGRPGRGASSKPWSPCGQELSRQDHTVG